MPSTGADRTRRPGGVLIGWWRAQESRWVVPRLGLPPPAVADRQQKAAQAAPGSWDRVSDAEHLSRDEAVDAVRWRYQAGGLDLRALGRGAYKASCRSVAERAGVG